MDKKYIELEINRHQSIKMELANGKEVVVVLGRTKRFGLGCQLWFNAPREISIMREELLHRTWSGGQGEGIDDGAH